MDTQPPRSASVPARGAGRTAFEAFRPTVAKLPLHEVSFRAMGCDCQILVLGGTAALLDLGVARAKGLDDCWSRFDPASELSRLNARSGHPTLVSPDMMILLRRSIAGFRISRGLFNPFLTHQISAAGYDRDFDEMVKAPVTLPAAADDAGGAVETGQSNALTGRQWRPRLAAARDWNPLRLDVRARLARLAPGVAVDSGGIGKGLGAELIADFLLSNGAAGAMVSLGGDVAVAGRYPDEGWRIGVDDPFGRPQNAMSVVLRAGALCSSGVLRRRWTTSDGALGHHIIDPKTGRSLDPNGLVGVSAIAPAGWLAEVLTKTLLVGGIEVGREVAARHGQCAFLLWDEQAEVIRLP